MFIAIITRCINNVPVLGPHKCTQYFTGGKLMSGSIVWGTESSEAEVASYAHINI